MLVCVICHHIFFHLLRRDCWLYEEREGTADADNSDAMKRKPGYFAARQDKNSGAQANGAGTNLRAVAKCSGMRR
jgi:hypothetical protein